MSQRSQAGASIPGWAESARPHLAQSSARTQSVARASMPAPPMPRSWSASLSARRPAWRASRRRMHGRGAHLPAIDTVVSLYDEETTACCLGRTTPAHISSPWSGDKGGARADGCRPVRLAAQPVPPRSAPTRTTGSWACDVSRVHQKRSRLASWSPRPKRRPLDDAAASCHPGLTLRRPWERPVGSRRRPPGPRRPRPAPRLTQ